MPFEVIKQINEGTYPEDIEKYNSYLTARFYSFFPDTLYFAQLINLNHDLSSELQINFLINTIRKSKRYHKWLKREEIENYDLVQEYFGFSDKKVKDALKILSEKNIKRIKELKKGEMT